MKKVLLFIFLFIICVFKIDALEINKMYVDAEVELAGAVKFKVLVQASDFNEEFNYKIYVKDEYLKEFDKSRESFEKSSIYNATSVDKVKVGYLKDGAKFEDFYESENFSDNVTFVEGIEILDKDGYSIIGIENLSGKKDVTYYIEYVVTNILVEHNDSTELYYTFLDNFGYDIQEVKILTRLATNSSLFEVWSHGSDGFKISKDISAGFVVIEKNNFKEDDRVDLRILFDSDLFVLNINKDKKTNMDAIKIVKDIEEERMNNTTIENVLFISLIIISILSVVLIVLYFIYKKVYKRKH